MQNSGILESHQGAPKNPAGDGSVQQSDEEKALVKQVDKLFRKAAKHRKQYDCEWVNNYKMYRGMQWLKKRPSYKHKEVVNLIYQTIQSQTSVMLDVRPTLGFLPRDPSDLELSEIIQMVFQADWERGGWSDELMAVIYDAHLYSVGFSGLEYKKDLNKGFGGQEYASEDAFDFYMDPDATDVNKRCEYMLKVKPEDVDKLKKRYHGHKYVGEIKPDVEVLDYERRTIETLHRAKNTNLDLPTETASSLSAEDDECKSQAMVITAFLKPSDIEEVEEDDEETGEKLFITRKKYPRGRKVVKINQFIFEDTELPDDHLEFPFSRCLNSVLPREFYGVSELDNTKGPQMVFNKLINFSLDVLTLMGNPVWKVPVEGNVNTRKLNNSPGLIVEYANDKEPHREEGVQLQPYVLQLIDRMEKWFNDEAGTQDVTRGVNPTGVTANAAIENLLSQAEKRIKQKMRNMDSYLKTMGRQWVSNVFQYYTAPQIFRLTNKEGANKYFKFSVEERDVQADPSQPPTKEKFAIVRDYVQNGETGNLTAANEAKEYQVRGDFDIIVNTISGLPFSEAQKQDKLQGLFRDGIIDAEEVLKGIDYPNYQAVLQRVQQQQQAAAQAQPQGA